MRTHQFLRAARQRARRAAAGVTTLAMVLALGACSTLLDVDFPGRIPSEQLDDPSLAPVLARSVVGDFECAYSNHSGGSSVHSDEWETANSNVPGANWGERSITADEDSYAIGPCESAYFGMFFTLNSARFQADDIFARLSAWTDAEVPGRTGLMATVRAYGAYANVLMGETFCQVAYDGGAAQPPSTALNRAVTEFGEAITLAGQANDADIRNLARVGLARAHLALKNWSAAEAAARQVPAGYSKSISRGSENSRRWNDISRSMTTLGSYTVATALRTPGRPPTAGDNGAGGTSDPRFGVYDSGRGAFNPGTALWLTNKHTALNDPIRLASYIEAQLILAEALIQQDKIPEAMGIINTRRAQVGLGALNPASKAAAITVVIEERRAELSFEGGNRLNDLLRYNLPWKGANGSTVATNPFTARPYGSTTCWPVPTKETNGA